MDTIKCVHCGAELALNQYLCTNCGCRPVKEFDITIHRKKAFTGCLAPLVINIYNATVKESLSIENDSTQSVKLPAGEYNFKLSLGVIMDEFKVLISKDSSYEVGAKMGMWVNKVYLQEIF